MIRPRASETCKDASASVRWLALGACVCLLVLNACRENAALRSAYPDRVGDIAFDQQLDRADFHLCDETYIYQYFNDSEGFAYEGEKQAIEKVFARSYKTDVREGESGWIRIRFVVNCEGQTDRFRLIACDKNYEAKTFNAVITDQLLSLTKSLKGWKMKAMDGEPIDYYQFLSFKLENGAIVAILP